MSKLLVKNFGPITSGCNSEDGFIDIKQCSVFIGPQGSGKSCVVKLISLFSWLEKNLSTENIREKIETKSFITKLFDYHGITEYLNKETVLEYQGDVFNFSLKEGKLKATETKATYVRPKILYIPADRSFCTAIKNPGKITGLPENTFEFLLDFTDAELALNKQLYSIPINGFSFSYDEAKKQAFLLDERKNYKIGISSASSGILSALPLTLTTAYYSGFLSVRPINRSLDQLNEMYKDALNRIGKIQLSLSGIESINSGTSISEIKQKAKIIRNLGKELSSLQVYVKRPDEVVSELINSRLINIVEEPEQNLFPEAQADVLYYLLKCMNSGDVLGGKNSLIMTTHSPYVIEALNNSMYAKRLIDSGKDVADLLDTNELVSYDDVSAYKLSDGIIENIKDDELKQIDAGYLDSCSERIRNIYSKLEDIEFSNE